jgi:EAL domain-containing protein (putative c-di-GMP-specific phosphodiesterase class I)
VIAPSQSSNGICAGECPGGSRIATAFQPIVDLRSKEVIAYEALARGTHGEGAATVFSWAGEKDQYSFDQTCRTKALGLAAQLGMPECLNLNFLPNAVYHAEEFIRATLSAAEQLSFPSNRIVFEFTESKPVVDVVRLSAIIREYRQQGVRTAIDDFGSGYAGLGLLADLQPDFIKLDMSLIRDIDSDRIRRVIVKGILSTCQALAIDVVAEGVETIGEMAVLFDLGTRYFQGYLFAKPGLGSLPMVDWPEALEVRQMTTCQEPDTPNRP